MADLELQRQQTSEFDAEDEPRRDTPTPPARDRDVPGVIGLVSDNVGESGEESEDEWNYYRVDPSEKPQRSVEKESQEKQDVCKQEPLNIEDSDENMESQLNPDAAEFIPSPTHNRPPLEEILSSANKLPVSEEDSVPTADLLANQEKCQDEQKEEISPQQDVLVNPFSGDSSLSGEEFSEKGHSFGLDESTAFSTKAEFGDESVTSTTDFQKTDNTKNLMDSSLVEQDFLTSEEQTGCETLDNSIEPSILEQESEHTRDVADKVQQEPIPISFELRNEMVPKMELQPELVKVDSDDQSPTLESESLSVNDASESNVIAEKEDLISGGHMNPELNNFHEITKPTFEINTELVQSDLSAETSVTNDASPLQDASDKLLFEDNVLDLCRQVENLTFESQVEEPEEKIELSPHNSDSSLSELKVLKLGDEISTPEYEKLERDLEASERYQGELMAADTNSLGFLSSEVNISTDNGVLLESAHPDKEELLNDACVETGLGTGTVGDSFGDNFAQLNKVSETASCPVQDLLEPKQLENFSLVETIADVPKEVTQLENTKMNGDRPIDIVHPRETEDIIAKISDAECEIHPSNNSFRTDSVFSVETAGNDLLGISQAPPPTPLVTHLVEPLDFSTNNISEVVERLSVTQSGEITSSEVEAIPDASCDVLQNGVLATEDSNAAATLQSPAVMSQPESSPIVTEEVERESDVPCVDDNASVVVAAVAATAGATVAVASGITTAITKSTASSVKKDKELLGKKTAAVTSKDKRPSTEKPKTAVKSSVSSRLTATTKAKSPTSPVKAPTVPKTAAAKPLTNVPSKPLAKAPVTKTQTKTLSSVPQRIALATAGSKAKPSPPTRPAASTTVNVARTRPASATLEKRPLTNGDVKISPKRPEQPASKTTLNKPSPRPLSAPISKVASKSPSPAMTAAKTKAPLNGSVKQRPMSSVAQVRTTVKSSNDKEVKETANKQISTRTVTSNVRSTTVSTASKASVTSASRKTESRVVANGKGPVSKSSGMVKTTTSTSANKISLKKPATTTNVKATKTDTIIEKSETVEGSKTVIATNE